MAKPTVLVLRAPGTNCDLETAHAFEMAGGQTERIHVNQLLDDGDVLQRFQILCLPGGFSYGDDVAAGKVLGAKIQHHLFEQLREFHADGKLLLGICNGFQVLLKCGLLFADPTAAAPATLTWNDHGRYEARWVTLQTESDRCVFLRDVKEMYLPVAHAEGKFVTRDAETMEQLESNGQLALRYVVPVRGQVARSESSKRVVTSSTRTAETLFPVAEKGNSADSGSDPENWIPFPFNPNGSQEAVAGLCDPTGRAFGLMPHPERFVQPTQHPRWTRDGLQPVGDGLRIFQNAVEYFA